LQLLDVSGNDEIYYIFRYRASIGGTPGGIASKLPGWILKSMHPVDSFGEAQGRLARFFKKFQERQDHNS